MTNLLLHQEKSLAAVWRRPARNRDMNRTCKRRGWSSSAPASPASPPACYAARSGYRTTILEMEQVPGGLCTSWRRKGYLFDGSVAGLAGTSPEAPIHRLWRDIGVVDYCALYDPVDFGTVVAADGRAVHRVHGHRPARGSPARELPGRCGRQSGKFTGQLPRLRAARHPVPRRGRAVAGALAGARTGAVVAAQPCRRLLKYGRPHAPPVQRTGCRTRSAGRCSTTSSTSAVRTCRCSPSCCPSPTRTDG